MDIKEELTRLPKSWAYVAVNGNKQPYQKDWQNKPLSRLDLFKEITAGRAKAIGVVSGPKSGIMFLDHDGQSCTQWLTENKLSIGSLPHSWMVTSGRVGRFQLIYKVPKKYWSKIKTRKYKTGKKDLEGNIEQVELRWEACQSVVAGQHPSTDGYRWMEGRSPSDLSLAEAPESLLKKMMDEPVKTVKAEIFNSDSDKAISLITSINPSRADDYDQWLAVGLALHSVGNDKLLSYWEDWSKNSTKNKPNDCKDKWDSFGKRSGITLGTLFKYAQDDGWTPPPRSFPSTLATTSEELAQPIPRKLEQLTSQELIDFLRNQKQNIRFNTFTHNIEVDGSTIKNTDLFYLQLAQKGFKVSKELAIDCLLLVAHENEYDPVKIYLDFCLKNVEPAYIDSLATAYLRPSDKGPTIYDAMLKATLINAVRRVYEPGAKHDSACVLMGPQGARKSSFWKTLGGAFFSDGLADLASKDDLLVLHRSWIMEWAELDHITNKKHAGQIKSFLSRSTDLLRVPYGRAVEEFPRRGVIVGSTNKDSGFLVDETGNRRFWCIPVEKTMNTPIDLDTLQLERDSIFAAAVRAYKNREPHYLTTEQENEIAQQNLGYIVESPWKPSIESWLASPTNYQKTITTELLLTEAIEKPLDRQNRADQMQVSTILKTLGYNRKRKSIGGQLKWVWLPTSIPREGS